MKAIIILLLQILSLSKQSENYELMFDSLFNYNHTYIVSLHNCPQMEAGNFHYRGRPKFIKDIINAEILDKNPIIKEKINYEK